MTSRFRFVYAILLVAVVLLPRAAIAQRPVWALDFVSTGSASAAVQSQAVLTARVRLSGSPAPAGGVTISLASSDPRVLSMPASVTVPAGRSEALFEVRAAVVSIPIRIDVRATGSGRTQIASVTVTPASASQQMRMNPVRGGASSSASGGASAGASAGSPGSAAAGGASAGGLSAAGVGGAAAAGAKSPGAASSAAPGVATGGSVAQGGAACAGAAALATAASGCGTGVGAASTGVGTPAGGVASAGSAAAAAGGVAGASAGAAASAASSGVVAAAGGAPAPQGGAAGGAPASAALSVLVSPPHAVAGKMASFVIQARTQANALRTTGGDVFAARLSGPQDAPVSIKDAGNGTYVGSFVVNTAGAYALHVLLAGVPINGSPFAIFVK
jgi:hypothetical protein